jgi:hypothetical protein
MKHRIALAVIALLVTAPLFAQAPKGWMLRADHSADASDPDAGGAIKFVASGSGFHATNPMAAVYWNPANTATGNYTLKGKFTQIKATGYNEYYGLVFGGADLAGAGQTYMYFMVSDDGTFLIKQRAANGGAQTVSAKTPNAAVKKADASGQCSNSLEVRVMADKIDFVINGTVVHSMPKTGAAAKTDGVYGIRVNHQLEVQIDGFGMTKM